MTEISSISLAQVTFISGTSAYAVTLNSEVEHIAGTICSPKVCEAKRIGSASGPVADMVCILRNTALTKAYCNPSFSSNLPING